MFLDRREITGTVQLPDELRDRKIGGRFDLDGLRTLVNCPLCASRI
jgi:hypothetical protein